jgi:hypothetical protein
MTPPNTLVIVSTLRWLLIVGLAAHGIAHAAGFAVAWRLTSSPEIPYHTALLNGRFEVGDTGIRIVGLLWLAAAFMFLAAAGLLAAHHRFGLVALALATTMSLILCLVEWPFSRVGLVINVLLLVMLPAIGTLLWRGNAQQLMAALNASQATAPAGAEIESPLPAPVSRYLTRALPSAQRRIRSATLTQNAEFFLGDRWRPLRATQRFTVEPAGFVWDARIAMMPLVSVFVRDGYVNGVASMAADFMGIYPIVRLSGRRELDAGALHRYLAEAVWFPTALTPAAGVRWTPLTDRAALATISDGHTVVSAEFRFNQDGDVEEVFVPDRFAETNGQFEPRPWLVRCSEHEDREGVRIPGRCEVEWHLPSGPQPYWRGRVMDVVYEWDGALSDSTPDVVGTIGGDSGAPPL